MLIFTRRHENLLVTSLTGTSVAVLRRHHDDAASVARLLPGRLLRRRLRVVPAQQGVRVSRQGLRQAVRVYGTSAQLLPQRSGTCMHYVIILHNWGVTCEMYRYMCGPWVLFIFSACTMYRSTICIIFYYEFFNVVVCFCSCYAHAMSVQVMRTLNPPTEEMKSSQNQCILHVLIQQCLLWSVITPYAYNSYCDVIGDQTNA